MISADLHATRRDTIREVKTTRLFRWSGGIAIGAVAALILRSLAGLPENPIVPIAVLILIPAAPVFAVSATAHLLRGLLWRVGTRFLVSYLLIVGIPLPFLVLLGYSAAWMISGQLAARRTEAAFEARLSLLELAAQELSAGISLRDPKSRLARFEEIARTRAVDLPGLGFAWRERPGGPMEGAGPVAPGELLGRSWTLPGRSRSLAKLGDRRFLVVRVDPAPGELVLLIPIGDELLGRLEAETDIALDEASVRRTDGTDEKEVRVEGDASPRGISIRTGDREYRPRPGGSSAPASTAEASEPTERRTLARSLGSGPIEGRWVSWVASLDRPVIDWTSGKPVADDEVGLVVHTSIALEYRRLFGRRDLVAGAARSDSGSDVIRVLRSLGWTTLIVEIIATVIALILVFRIARATSRLGAGFSEIERGNFAFRASMRGRDQLTGLIDGFNRMAGHLEGAVAARAERELLERELSLARDLQRRLLPSSDFTFPRIEIATDFRPAAAIGGDFYHFIAEGAESLVVVIADVSGHGLPTGIVMASAKASLSALASTGADTAAILETLDEEIRRTTDRRTFVTLGHARLLPESGFLELTNAGHPYPYRVTAAGEVSTVEAPSRPLGVGLPTRFETIRSPLAAGDLWVFYSDGIVEALGPDGEPFGFERLERVLARCGGRGAAETRDEILAEWRTVAGRDEPEDDRTLLVLRILPKG
jgi:HAMP domain-containing protein